ncbi:hypothetical protein RCZ04_08640 [Capnocytophaga sp. HP1101]
MKKIILILTAVLLVSCKTKQVAVTPAGRTSVDKQTKEIINQHLKSFPTFKTLSANLQVTYNDGKNEQTLPLSFRMEKDKTIWISAPLGIAKALITPEKAEYYNRLDSSFFSGDFSYISKLLGVDVGFNELQNLLLGNALYDLNFKSEGIIKLLPDDNNRYNIEVTGESPVEVIYRIFPDNYRIEVTEVNRTNQKAVTTYSYQQVGELLLPHTIKIVASEGENSTQITLEFKGLDLDKKQSFPFKIPSGMKEITIKN